jgi:hypothetical protein
MRVPLVSWPWGAVLATRSARGEIGGDGFELLEQEQDLARLLHVKLVSRIGGRVLRERRWGRGGLD